MRLRRFLYLDTALTETFLTQTGIEVYEEEELTEESESARGLGAGLRAGPAQAGGGVGKGQRRVSSRTVAQTPESKFTRLMAAIDDDVLHMETADDSTWSKLRRGDPLEVECRMSVPMVVQVGLMLATAPVADIAAAFGTQLDADAEKTIQQIGTFINLLKALPVLCELAGSPKYKFVTPVAPQFLRCKLDDLSGDATIFATLDKKIAGREKWNMLDALGLGSLPRETRRDFERSVGKDSTLRDFTVSAPAAVLAPVAIFR